MSQRSHILILAGHIDHGKTALVNALTGATHLDRRKEEKERGITMDLGFTELNLQSESSGDAYRLGIIDVPGHADFVKNMVAGMAAVDMGLLVVAADDGWMPQTEEHLQILMYLGVKQLVVAISKADIDPEMTELVCDQVKAELVDTPFAQAPIIPVSSTAMTGLEALQQALTRVVEQLPPSADYSRARLFIDRVITLEGHGKVITGTLAEGCLSVKDTVYWFPFGDALRIRSLQQFGQDCREAAPGTRVAINVAHAGSQGTRLEQLHRGQALLAQPVNREDASLVIDVVIKRLDRGQTVLKQSMRPLKHDSRLYVHVGSQKVAAHLLLLQGQTLRANEQALARLKLAEPLPVIWGDRILLRDWSEQTTLAGGIVLDSKPPKTSSPRKGIQADFLASRCEAPFDWERSLQALLKRDGILDCPAVLKLLPLSLDAFQAITEKLVQTQCAYLWRDFLFEQQRWKANCAQVCEWITAFHEVAPFEPGFRLSELSSRWKAQANMRIFPLDALLESLADSGFVVEGDSVRATIHRAHLTEALQAVADALLKRMEQADNGLLILPPEEVKPEEHDALRFLVYTDSVVPIGEQGYLTKDAYNLKVQSLQQFLNKHGRARVSELREPAQLQRKYLVPFLELLDENKITLREGDYRTVSKKST